MNRLCHGFLELSYKQSLIQYFQKISNSNLPFPLTGGLVGKGGNIGKGGNGAGNGVGNGVGVALCKRRSQ